MGDSVARVAGAMGMPAAGLQALERAHRLAMETRVRALDDDHHPSFLHPGRTVLILLRDVGCVVPDVLCAAALSESEEEGLRVSLESVREAMGSVVSDLVGAVPRAGDERLAEALVTASAEVRLVALAERLDHLRHAHLRGGDAAWARALHDEARSVYAPVAHRTHPALARRYDHWCRTFARRVARG